MNRQSIAKSVASLLLLFVLVSFGGWMTPSTGGSVGPTIANDVAIANGTRLHQINDSGSIKSSKDTRTSFLKPLRSSSASQFRVKASDPEYDAEGPFVLERHKLLFYCIPKVGSTVWKILFRRLAGFSNWNQQGNGLPHDPKKNGLTKLKDYSTRRASAFFSTSNFTVAIFVRDPLERFVSAYRNKGRDKNYMMQNCCKGRRRTRRRCVQRAAASVESFFQVISKTCPNDPHWQPQSQRLSMRYWKRVNFVGHFESLTADSEQLFRRINVWHLPEIQTGWGPYGTERIFSPNATIGRLHARGGAAAAGEGGKPSSKGETKNGILTPKLQAKLVKFYMQDYQHPFLNFTLPAT